MDWQADASCVGFIVTNLSRLTERVVAFYNHRGTAERYIKEGKHAIKWTRLSCGKFRNNKARLQLHALAYNLGVFLQGIGLPEELANWSLSSIQTRLIKIGARVVRHARAITFQLAEVAVSGDLLNRILAAIPAAFVPMSAFRRSCVSRWRAQPMDGLSEQG
jgi:hypothetical protein